MLTSAIAGGYDLAIVGGGIIGLAHAYAAAKRGMRVAVFEQSQQAAGASVRNFGLIWPMGQPSANYRLAMRSRELWLEVLRASGLYHEATGSLHVTYREDEAEVAREFARLGPPAGFHCEWLDGKQALARSKAIRTESLAGALWSPAEVTVDPRQVLAELPSFLASEWGVAFHFGATVQSIEMPELRVAGERFRARQVVVCSGSELNHLYRSELARFGLRLCKLQMMRTGAQPESWRLRLAGASRSHCARDAGIRSLGHSYDGLAGCGRQLDSWRFP